MSVLESVVRHAALALAVVALAGAGLRVAAWSGARGLTLVAGAAPVAAALAVLEALALGLVALGGSPIALTGAALLTWLAARRLPAPDVSSQLREWWRALPAARRVLAGAVAGAWAAWAAWLVAFPAFGHDMLLYHLPEAIGWVHRGTPGSVQAVVDALPVGYYPVTHEVLLGWGMAIASSFVWATLVTAAAPPLAALAAYATLRAVGAARLVAWLGSLALVATPGVIASQNGGAALDPAALAWLCCCGCLVVGARREPRLLVPALLAGGLALGTKTTAATLVLVALAIGVWTARDSLRPLRAQLGVAAAAALAAGGYWYLRDLVSHGSPLWPFVATPWGDPRPRAIEIADVSFLDRPGATWDKLHRYYFTHFGGPMLILAAALLVPLAVRRRVVLGGAALVALSLLLWLEAPFTGLFQARFYVGVGDATRYLLPGVAAAVLTLGLASRAGRAARAGVAAVFAAAIVVGVSNTFGIGFPSAPSHATPILGALAGAVAALVVGRARIPTARWRIAAVALCVLVAGAGGALAARGYGERHGKTGTLQAGLLRFMAAQPAWRDGSAPVASSFSLIGPLAGDHFQHHLELIRPGDRCDHLQALRERAWIVLGGLSDPSRRCFQGQAKAFEDPDYVVYGPP